MIPPQKQSELKRHLITVFTVARCPQIEHLREEVIKTEGTAVCIERDSASSDAPVKNRGFYKTSCATMPVQRDIQPLGGQTGAAISCYQRPRDRVVHPR